MNEADERNLEIIRKKLNRDTAKINWSALHEHQTQQSVIAVSVDLDLIDVACEFTLGAGARTKARHEVDCQEVPYGLALTPGSQVSLLSAG